MAILSAPQKLYTQNQPHPNQPPRSVLNILSHYSRTIQRSAYFVWYSSSPSMCRGKRNIDVRKLTHEKSTALSTRSPPSLDLLPPHLRSLAAACTLPPHTLLIPPPFRCSSFLRDSPPPPSWTCRPAPSSTCRLGDLDRGQHKSGRVFTTVAAASKMRHQ